MSELKEYSLRLTALEIGFIQGCLFRDVTDDIESNRPVKMAIDLTRKLQSHSGIDCRVWEGQTERGVKIQCLIPRIAVKNGQDVSQFEAELKEQSAPSADAVAVFPMRMIL